MSYDIDLSCIISHSPQYRILASRYLDSYRIYKNIFTYPNEDLFLERMALWLPQLQVPVRMALDLHLPWHRSDEVLRTLAGIPCKAGKQMEVLFIHGAINPVETDLLHHLNDLAEFHFDSLILHPPQTTSQGNPQPL